MKEYKMTNKDSREWMKDLPIYIMTADQQMCCLPAFCYLFNKFWSNEVTINVIGYSKPNFNLPSNVNYISMGIDRGAEYWSDDMISFFSNIKDDLFYLTTEDGFILKEIDSTLLFNAYAFSKEMTLVNDNFLRFNLTHCVSSRAHTLVKNIENNNQIIIANKGTDYRHSLQHSLWNRKNFLNILSNNMTPWQIELDETARYSRYDIYAFKGNCPLNVGHGYSKGKKVNNWYHDVWSHMSGFDNLNNEDIKVINDNNWIPEINVKVLRDSGGKIIR